MNKFYLTTAIPYVNGRPHIGHALEYFQADTVRRYQRDILKKETLLLSGADENALKNVQAAESEGTPIKEFLDKNSEVFRKTFETLGIELDVFQRGSDQEKHWPGVQKFWNLCFENGDIYKKSYTGLYCVGCESFKTESELIGGLCPDHQKKLEEVTEENYFFKLSKYQDKLTELIESDELKIVPENKRQEILSFIKSGLEDFSVSRSKDRARGVGVPVPNDDTQVIYVWFDALNIYMTGVGFGWDSAKWEKWWPADIHVIGKDINRFHTVYWPAMLLSAKIKLPKQILVHSFIQSGGQKMSKSLGNVIDPFEMIEKFGVEPFRYFLLSQIPIDSDGDFTESRFQEVYNSDLANGLGNLVARIAKLAESCNIALGESSGDYPEDVKNHLDKFEFDKAISVIWNSIKQIDRDINVQEPWKITDFDVKQDTVAGFAARVFWIGYALQPFLPETSKKILNQFSGKIKSEESLFPRLI